MNCTNDGSLNADNLKRFLKVLSSGKYEFPILGQELYILPASIPETNAPIVICTNTNVKKNNGIKG